MGVGGLKRNQKTFIIQKKPNQKPHEKNSEFYKINVYPSLNSVAKSLAETEIV